MFYYIDQPRNPIWHREITLVTDVISIDVYYFLAFSDLACHLEDAGIGVFWLDGTAW